MTAQRIYLDFNASRPLAPEVVEAMQPFLTHSTSAISYRPLRGEKLFIANSGLSCTVGKSLIEIDYRPERRQGINIK